MNARTAKLIHKMAVRLGVKEKVIKRRWLALNTKEKAAARHQEGKASSATFEELLR